MVPLSAGWGWRRCGLGKWRKNEIKRVRMEISKTRNFLVFYYSFITPRNKHWNLSRAFKSHIRHILRDEKYFQTFFIYDRTQLSIQFVKISRDFIITSLYIFLISFIHPSYREASEILSGCLLEQTRFYLTSNVLASKRPKGNVWILIAKCLPICWASGWLKRNSSNLSIIQ